MARPEKEAAIEELKENIGSSSIAILTKYQGINVSDVTALRAKLRGEDVLFRVYKNTLARRALDELELSEVADFIEGPTAWAFCKDPVAPAKILKEFSKDVSAIRMQGGILDGKVVDAETLITLAQLPSRDQLLAHTVATIAAPLRNLVGVLSAVSRNFVNVLDQIRIQKEEAGAA